MQIRNGSIRLYNSLTRWKSSLTLYLCASLVVLVARWPAHDSEDIKNLRNNFESQNPTDFWGGFSALFYGYFPNFYPGWESLLLTFQWALATAGVILTLRHSKNLTIKSSILITIILISLSTLITRDALMLSLILFGIGVSFSYKYSELKFKNIILFSSVLSFFIASCFRPWVSPAIAILTLYLYPGFRGLSSRLWRTLVISGFCIIFSVASLGAEIISSKLLHLGTSFPQQQVMMMDLSASACWSTNPNSVESAIKGLKYFYADRKVPDYFCNTFRPTNWIHLFHEDMLTGNQPEFRIIPIGDSQTYLGIRNSWITNIVQNPVDYIQTKFMFLSQTLLGGDTRRIHLFQPEYYGNSNRSEIFLVFSALVLAPLDIVIALHLLSPLISILLLVFFLIWRIRRNATLDDLDQLFWLGTFQFLWVFCTVIAYIGDTARFTYTSGATVFLLILYEKNSSAKRNV